MNAWDYWDGRLLARKANLTAAETRGWTPAKTDYEQGVFDEANGIAPRVAQPTTPRPAAGSGFAPLPSTNGTRDDYRAYAEGYASDPALPDQAARGAWFMAGQIDRRRGNQPQAVRLAGNVWGPNPNITTPGPMANNTGSVYRGGVQRDRNGNVIVAPPPGPSGNPAPVTGGGTYGKAPPYGSIPPAVPTVPYGSPWGPYGWNQPRFYEVSATLLGKRKPLDQVIKLQKLAGSNEWAVLGIGFGTDIQILGGDPSDDRRGYRLSGPNSAFAAKVREAIALGKLPPDPRYLGLDGWYGAQTSTGIRVLTKRDLDSLDIAPSLSLGL